MTWKPFWFGVFVCRVRLHSPGPCRSRPSPSPICDAPTTITDAGAVPTAASLAFQVMLQPLQSWDLRTNHGFQILPPASAGDAFLFDLSQNPRVALQTPFDMMRIYIPEKTLNALTYERGLRPIGGLRAAHSGRKDTILHGLAIALRAAMERPREASALFVDSVALAVHAHVVETYGGAMEPPARQGGLASWQLRRVTEAMTAELGADHAVAALAQECGLSASYFTRAFKRSTGVAPHQRLLRRRVEQAKALMKQTEMDLTEISLACGFVDQSHFSRVFAQHEKQSPGRWRRMLAK